MYFNAMQIKGIQVAKWIVKVGFMNNRIYLFSCCLVSQHERYFIRVISPIKVISNIEQLSQIRDIEIIICPWI